MVRVSKYTDNSFLPKGLNFSIVKRKSINDRLYRFVIKHPDTKYISYYTLSIGKYGSSKSIDCINITDGDASVDVYGATTGSITGEVKGGSIRVTSSGKHGLLFHFVPLKWETVVFVIIDWLKEGDL